ncbi:MAG: serine hydrolase [bacterium]|nr:serine hydrolase [bacterium]
MNRHIILLFLLTMFLSCGNSAGEATLRFNGTESAFNASPLSKEEIVMANKLDELFTGLNSKGSFNGCVLVSKAGKILYKRSLGFLNKSTKNLLTDSSMFQLASVSKVITATAVLLLYERGLLDIEAPFKNYFPDFPYNDVRIRDLLSHRSGLPNYMYTLNNQMCQPDSNMNNLTMYNCFVSKNAPPYLKPDRRFNYCNTNYAMLALLIEKVSGLSYSRFLKEELFRPLGMNNTATIRDIDLEGSNTTKPYDNRWRPINFEASDFVLGDKSIYSTTHDLFLFSEALYQNRIIRPATQQMAYTAFSKEIKLSNYGYGWRMKNFKDPDKKDVYHNGWWHGYRSSFHRRLKDTLTVVILSNQLNSSTYQVQKVYDILDSNVSTGEVDDEE